MGIYGVKALTGGRRVCRVEMTRLEKRSRVELSALQSRAAARPPWGLCIFVEPPAGQPPGKSCTLSLQGVSRAPHSCPSAPHGARSLFVFRSVFSLEGNLAL